ncbi:MAG: O-antigen ligase family protein [Solirubrobacterales bacterium]
MTRISEGALIAVVVAAAYAALSYASGGYSSELIAATTLAIWWVVILALLTRVWPGRAIPRSAVAAGISLAAFGAFTALSMIWAPSPGLSFTELVRVAGYLGLFVLIVIASGRTGPRPWLIGLALGLVVVALGGLASRFDPSLFGGADRDIFAFIPFSHGRLSYPVGYWNGLGACLALGLVLLGWLSAEAPTRLTRALATAALPAFGLAMYLTSSRGGVAAAVVGGIALLAMSRTWAQQLGSYLIGGVGAAVLAVIASQENDFTNALTTHTAYVQGREMAAATVASIVIVGIARYLVDRPLSSVQLSAKVVRGGIAAVVAIGLVVLVASNPVDRIREFSNSNDVGSGPSLGAQHFTAASGSGRYQFWGQAVDAFESRPVYGIGAGNYQLWWNSHAPINVQTLDAHSLYLQTLAELGVVGLLLLLAFLGCVLVAGFRRTLAFRHAGRWGDALAAALALFLAGLASAALDWTWQLPAAFAPVILAAALLTGPASVPQAAIEPGVAARRAAWRWVPGRILGGRQYGLGVATLICAWAAVWIAGDQLVAKVQLDNSHSAAAGDDFGSATQDARDAAAIQPWASEPQVQLALVAKDAGDLEAARIAAAKAIQRAPQDWRPWLVSAEVEAALGNRGAASRYLTRANQLSPGTLPVNLQSSER